MRGRTLIASRAPPPGGEWAFGFNFRAHQTHDDAHTRNDPSDVWAAAGNHPYPTSYTNDDGQQTDAGYVAHANALANLVAENSFEAYWGQDARLAGHIFCDNNALIGVYHYIWQIDLPQQGDYDIHVGMARRSTAAARPGGYRPYQTTADAQNDTNPLAAHIESDIPGNNVLDATGILHADAATWAASQNAQRVTINQDDPVLLKPILCIRFFFTGTYGSVFSYWNHIRATLV